ncbi:hypothetical protein ABFX02_08G030000 [Erythranthe guttata]
MERKPHVVAIPYPAQGHVIPMMKVAQYLAENGLKVTFVNTEFNHQRVTKALSQTGNIHELINLVSIPDGLESWEDRNEHGKLAEATVKIMPKELENLIQEMNRTESDDIITCVLVDFYMAGILPVVEKIGIKRAAFLPAPVALLALTLNVQKLVDDGIVDADGTPLTNQPIQLAPLMPKMSPMNFAWACFPDPSMGKPIFHSIIQNNESAKLIQRLICNSSHELEQPALNFIPNCSPIGPLLPSSHRLGKSAGHFWPEDSTCLAWLDQQPPNSVVYVAFGSFTVFDAIQFEELALGLESTNRPFLWVVRQDTNRDNEIEEAYPAGFAERVKNRGKMVGWSPQEQVLSHPAVACFISHCGWNSTVEGIGNGVPLLCWPYFADQFLNRSYIVDHWGVGLGLEKDENGIVRKEEIRVNVERIFDDEGYKSRAVKLQAKIFSSAHEGGSSHLNFHSFINWIKDN